MYRRQLRLQDVLPELNGDAHGMKRHQLVPLMKTDQANKLANRMLMMAAMLNIKDYNDRTVMLLNFEGGPGSNRSEREEN